jgi:FAD/FMN-containing dehydrogenase/Fe-S oxidoreductase
MSIPPDFISELRKRFTGDIRLDPASRILYSTDASIYQIEPLGVVLPRTQDDLHAAVELAAKHHLPILPRGSGSSLAGQAIGHALVLDLSRYLDKIVEVNPEVRTATVEPGVVLATLNRAAAKYGLTFGPDPASAERATIGGVIGNNATGAHSILYGMTADHLVSADVLLADGSLATFGEVSLDRARQLAADARPAPGFALTPLDTPASLEATLYTAALHIREKYADDIKASYPRTWRNSAGYRLNYLLPWSASQPPQWTDDRSLVTGHYPPVRPGTLNLAPLLAGSEGTLAVVRRATLNLVPKPKYTVLAVLAYDSVIAACEDVPRLLTFAPSAVELIPQMLIRLARDVPAYARQMDFVNGDPAALLVVEFAGDDSGKLAARARSIRNALRVIIEGEAQNRVWNVRKVGLGIFDSRPASARPIAFIEDCAIPVERLGEFVGEVERILSAHNTEAAFYAHASAGCLHIRALLDLRTGEGVRHLRSISEAVLSFTLRLGGAMSSEHGDGLVRSEWLKQTYGESVFEAFELLKRAADPQTILNPGKIVSSPPMDASLRYGENYRSMPWMPSLDFSRNGGLAAAIEQCNGQGICRKDAGVMCPSFQATRDEMHSTRGRANLLRAMISNPALRNTQHAPDRTYSVVRSEPLSRMAASALDLCLACKGCKAECPSGVDMAKLKYEFLHEFHKTHPRKLRDYLFAYIHRLAPLGAPFALLANRLMGLSTIKNWLHLAPDRPFPKLQSRSRSLPIVNHPLSTVIYLPDTFTRYFEPEIEQAALDILAACGLEARLLSSLGAARTLISKGFLNSARNHLGKLLDEIRQLDPEGKCPVVGTEPSELYTLRDELLDLLPGRRAEAESLARRAWTVEEFLVRPESEGEVRLLRIANILNTKQKPNNTQKEKIYLHGHCYQKAQPPSTDGYPIGQGASAQLLHTCGFEVEIIPSGCCGMAGAFGYEAEHHNLSIQVGELVLFPHIRQSNGIVSAPGASCRSQVADGTGVTARHPIKIVADLLSN